MKKIAIYTDKGAHPQGIRMLITSLRLFGFDKKYQVAPINSKIINDSDWESDTALLIFPGGRDIYYHNALKGKPNKRIKSFVKKGGSYLGICAGGYYGASSIEFEKGYPLEVVGDRELGFFPGVAVGSAYGPNLFNYENENGSRASKIKCLFQNGGLATSYFNGGCKFSGAKNYDNVKILANYFDIEDNPAAIVECKVNKGCAILSGVHFEYDLLHFAKISNKNIVIELLPQIQQLEKARQILFKTILERVLD